MGRVVLSVIVPVHNAEQTLSRCVDSILAQTFTNYELILVNDGSTDASASICSDYASQHSFIKVINQKHSGVSAARNAGIRAAQGERLTFVDADDEVTPTFLSTIMEEGMQHDLCMQSLIMVNQQGERTLKPLERTLLTEKDEMVATIYTMLRNDLPISTCCSLFRRDLLQQTGTWFDEKIHYCEDTDFILRYLQTCQTMCTLPTANYIYYTPTSAKGYYKQNALRTCLCMLRDVYQLTDNETLRKQYRSIYLDWGTEQLFQYHDGPAELHELAELYGKVCQPYLQESKRPSFRHRLFKRMCISPRANAIIFTAKQVMRTYRFLKLLYNKKGD